jgi:signal recognition particle receptor subunit beta
MCREKNSNEFLGRLSCSRNFHCVEKKTKNQVVSNSSNQTSTKEARKHEKKLFEKIMAQQQKAQEDGSDSDSRSDNSNNDDDDDDRPIGPMEEPKPIRDSHTNPHASRVDVFKCFNNYVGGDTKCVFFDVPFSSSLETWRNIYQQNIDCLIFVVDVSDPSKIKASAELFWNLVEILNKTSWQKRHASILLLANKIDLLNQIASEEVVDQMRESVLKTDGPIGSVFDVAKIRDRFDSFDFLATSAVTGEGIFNVLQFISQYTVYPMNAHEHQMKRMKKQRQDPSKFVF